ncbi:MAG: hypothetical protein OXK72_04165 [Gammaproteobacteria bacterium]|nr:hypothetical protein [Gammaproteobacteria bacterium]
MGWRRVGVHINWSKVLQGYGHEAKLMASQFVKVNKTDHTDVLVICEAVQRLSMRHVGIKSVMQQDHARFAA